MEIKLDPHRFESMYKAIMKSVEKSDISEKNKKLIFRFRDDCIRDGLSKARITKLLGIVRNMILDFDKDLNKVTKKDIERFILKLQQSEFSPWTKHSYKVIIKKFFKWYKGNSEHYPNEVKWIKTTINKKELRLPTEEGLITESDVKLLIRVAENSRDKAFIALLYESGCRIGELLTLRLKNVSFDEYGALLNVNGKTGSRKIRVIFATSYLVTWLENHPLKEDMESPLWVNYGCRNHNQPMIYRTACKMLRTVFSKSGIKKKNNPHLFRHSRATYLANHLTEFQMNKYFGWVQGSNMPSTYVHLSGREIDADLLALNGIKTKKEANESTLKPRKCPRCDNINSYDAKFCSKCAGILDIETAMKLEEKRLKELETRKEGDEIMNMLIRDPEFRKIFMEKIAMIGLNR